MDKQNILELLLAYIIKRSEKPDDSDEWTLGSGEVVETETVKLSDEEIQKTIESNVKVAGESRIMAKVMLLRFYRWHVRVRVMI